MFPPDAKEKPMKAQAWLAIALWVSAFAAPVRAQTGAPPATEPAARTTPFLEALRDTMAGEHVMAVDNGTTLREPRKTAPATNNELLHRLQVVCERYSDTKSALVPFAVRGAWVVAPQMRDDVQADFSGATPLDALGRGALLLLAVADVPASGVKALGSEEGIAFTALPDEARMALSRALHPPVPLAIQATPDAPGFIGRPGGDPVFPDAPDLSHVRLRAQLRSDGVRVPGTRTVQTMVSFGMRPKNPGAGRIVFFPKGMEDGVEIPATTRVPNTFKPSDLDGKTLGKPLGFHGIFTVRETVKRLANRTGIPLQCSPQYDQWPVFLGSDGITCGEALDGLRLALTAAWRKIGDTYLLTWDRRGLGALDRLAAERSGPVRNAIAGDLSKRTDDRRLELGLALPFASDDATAWTDAQRKKLFGPPDTTGASASPPDRVGRPFIYSPPPSIGFDAMTPAQQDAARALMEKAASRDAGQGSPPADLTDARLADGVRLEIGVSVPGVGWILGVRGYGTAITSDLYASRYAREAVEREIARGGPTAEMLAAARAATARAAASGAAKQPVSPDTLIPAENRALMVPALPMDALEDVAKAMKAKGFTALFYPAFTDGYATFPTTAFPLLPALKGRNGLADAARVAQANGIALAATVETLAWRKPKDKTHWLDSAPGWLDRDIVGRTLTQWVAADAPTERMRPVEARGDMARPSSETRLRLEHVLTDLARQPGVRGVLFDAWSAPTATGMEDAAVSLGYSVPDRIAALDAWGMDPVDAPRAAATLKPMDPGAVARPRPHFVTTADGGVSERTRQFAPSADRYAPLVTTLLNRAKALDGAWKLYLTIAGYPPLSNDGTPAARSPSWDLVNMEALPPMPDALIPLPSRAVVAGAANVDPRRRAAYDLGTAQWMGFWMPGGKPRHHVIYDFRDAPDAILNALDKAVLPEAE
jgi:hypothetical protein